jgi:hypothetical protein
MPPNQNPNTLFCINFQATAGLVIVIVLGFAISLAGTRASAEDLMKLGLDDVSTLGLTIENDSRIRVEGAGSVKITTLHPTAVCLGEVSGLDLANTTLIYRAHAKSQLEGSAFLEMWVQVDGGRYFSRGFNSTIEGHSDWQVIQTPFVFKKGQSPGRITLNLIISGTGTVWIDDVVLSKTASD